MRSKIIILHRQTKTSKCRREEILRVRTSYIGRKKILFDCCLAFYKNKREMSYNSILNKEKEKRNYENGKAYAMLPELELYSAVVTTLVADNYY